MEKPLWIDMEMTGLDESVHGILEVACVVTDYHFKTFEEYETVVFQPPEILSLMDDWCTKTHGASGLTAKVPHGKTLDVLESDLLALLDRHYKPDDRVVIAGNSIGNDRRFIDKYLPRFAKRLHYRMVDVSSFKEVFRNRYNVQFKKGDKHRAVDDIHESIRELETYLKMVTLQ